MEGANTTGLYLGIGFTTAFFLFHYIKASYASTKKTVAVEELWVFPIKSCGGIKMKSCEITRRGFKYDREFMLVDSSKRFVSQRSIPNMARISCDLDYQSKVLSCNAPGMVALQIYMEEITETPDCMVEVSVWDDVCSAVDLGDKIACWFSQFLQKPDIRIVRIAPRFKRKTDAKYAPEGETGFSDGYPFLLTSVESMDDLNKRLKSKVASPLSQLNFRPNIIVSGCAVPFAEDTWRDISFCNSTKGIVDEIKMTVVKPCSRCTVPSIDPNSGEFYSDKIELNKVLKSFRTGRKIGLKNEKWQGEIFFGQNLDHRSRDAGQISVGDTVRIDSFQ